MREILFRGKRIDNGEWVEGYYAKAKHIISEKEMHIIFPLDLGLFPHSEFSSYEEVDPATIGQQWISAKDRLPEVGGSYLVVVKEEYPYEAEWNVHVDVAGSHGDYIDDFWDTFNDWKEGQEVHVTHWMPLPEPPKET